MEKNEMKKIINEILLGYENGFSENMVYSLLHGLKLTKYEGKEVTSFITQLYEGGDVSDILDDYSTETPVNYRTLSPGQLLRLIQLMEV